MRARSAMAERPTNDWEGRDDPGSSRRHEVRIEQLRIADIPRCRNPLPESEPLQRRHLARESRKLRKARDPLPQQEHLRSWVCQLVPRYSADRGVFANADRGGSLASRVAAVGQATRLCSNLVAIGTASARSSGRPRRRYRSCCSASRREPRRPGGERALRGRCRWRRPSPRPGPSTGRRPWRRR